MILTKLLFVAALVLCIPAVARAQQAPCQLKLEDAPEIRGFRLGMSAAQVKARFPVFQLKPDEYGVAEFLIQVGGNVFGDKSLDGVESISLYFVDERLASFNVSYKNVIAWQSDEQFRERISRALNLPAAWNGPTLRCEGFSVTAYRNNISVSAPQAFEVTKRRRQEKEEKDRQSFKP
jgi:hypothetical protein